MERKFNVEVKITPEDVDTDRWGYIVCFGTVITFIAGIGHVNSFGLIYNDFINETHATAKSLTTAHGVFAGMLAIGGVILNILSKNYSLRFGGLIGSLIFVTGSVATIFVTSTNQLPVTFGVLQGVGFGMMVPASYATLNHYFVRKRTTVMSVCKAIQGIVLMFYPQLIKKIMSIYGLRGTSLILSGISLHTIPGMIVMNTKLKKPGETRKANGGKLTKRNDCEDWLCGEDKELSTRLDTAPVHRPRKCRNIPAQTISLINIAVYNKIMWTLMPGDRGEFSTQSIPGAFQRGPCVKVLSKIFNIYLSKDLRGYQILEILNVGVLKDPVYCNICIGQSFVNFSDLTFFIFLPMLLFQYGYDKSQVAMCISVCAGADVVGRCALAALSSVTTINTRWLYYIATALTLAMRIVILQVRQFQWVTLVTGALGVLRAWLHVASPLVISNHVANEDFPGAYAVFMLAAGLVNVTFAPLIGLLKDLYQDYVPAFYALTVCCLPCLVFWPLEYTLRSKYDAWCHWLIREG